jgi:hypothetical protein
MVLRTQYVPRWHAILLKDGTTKAGKADYG